jgi:hypothetical protein
MRLRGIVFERFVTFERAEVNLCDESGTPLDVVLFVGGAGAGKTALLRGISGVLSEAAGGEAELVSEDVRRNGSGSEARCRIVIDDVAAGGRVVVIEKDLTTGAVKGMPAEPWARWRDAMKEELAPRAAFSIASAGGGDGEGEGEDDGDDPLFEWLFARRGGPSWDAAIRAIDRVLWPYRFNHVTSDGDIVFEAPSGLASSLELGDAFESVLVMTIELIRLTTERPNEELVYVIDDLDAHLDPRWQSRIISDLRRAFPRVQLVATTHSPFVVASVEPYQVFRLVDGKITRVSDRVAKGAATSPVMDLAFGTPDLAGPRWAHSPPLPVQRELLKAIESSLERGSVVYALPEPIHVRDVKNAFNEPVLGLTEGAHGYLFFVDNEPGSAWGHSCEYVFRTRDGRIVRHEGIWPPVNLDRFVAIGRG